MMKNTSTLWLALALLTASACGDDSAEEPQPCEGDTCGEADTTADDTGTEPGLPAAICTEGTKFSAGTSVFAEETEAWGLVEAGAVGARINVADVNSDGYPDLLLRRGGSRFEAYEPLDPPVACEASADCPDAYNCPDGTCEPIRRTWLLINDGGQRFVDGTLDSGIVDTRISYATLLGRPIDVPAFGDVDNDGDLDVYTGISTANELQVQAERSELMLNNGEGIFTFTAADHPVRREGEIDSIAGASFLDFDLDGNLDLWLSNHNYEPPGGGIAFAQDHLYRGDGTGDMERVTDAVGLTTQDWVEIDDLNNARAHTRAWSAAACDLNNDGLPELLAASYGRSPNHLWQAQGTPGGDVSFVNRSVESGYAYDDNYVWENNQFAMCFCQSNPGAEGCEGVGSPAIGCSPNWQHSQDREAFRLGGNSGATVCADLNNDGWYDLVTTEIKHWWAGDGSDGSSILLNDGAQDVTFTRQEREAIGFEVPHVTGLSWDEGHMSAHVFDFDNDGWLDVYIGASDYAGNFGLLYHQSAPGQFTLLDTADYFEHNRSHGVVAADFDRDGDMDILVGHSRSRCDANQPNNCYDNQQFRIFENLLGDDGNWIEVTLVGGEGSNRGAVGARIDAVAGDLTMSRQVQGGFGHYGAQEDMTQHFGLGPNCEAEVTVTWPNAERTQETFTLPAGHRFRVVQGQGVEVIE